MGTSQEGASDNRKGGGNKIKCFAQVVEDGRKRRKEKKKEENSFNVRLHCLGSTKSKKKSESKTGTFLVKSLLKSFKIN